MEEEDVESNEASAEDMLENEEVVDGLKTEQPVHHQIQVNHNHKNFESFRIKLFSLRKFCLFVTLK